MYLGFVGQCHQSLCQLFDTSLDCVLPRLERGEQLIHAADLVIRFLRAQTHVLSGLVDTVILAIWHGSGYAAGGAAIQEKRQHGFHVL